jgi:hypothetical protein
MINLPVRAAVALFSAAERNQNAASFCYEKLESQERRNAVLEPSRPPFSCGWLSISRPQLNG